MVVIGLLVVLVAVALIVGAVYDGAEPVTMEAFGNELDTTVAGVFFTGVGTTLLLFLGLWLLKSATARSRKQRHERKQQRIRQRESVATLERERNELRAENERLVKKVGRPATGGATTSAAPSGTRDTTPSGKHADPQVAAGDHAPAPTQRPAGDNGPAPADETRRRT